MYVSGTRTQPTRPTRPAVALDPADQVSVDAWNQYHADAVSYNQWNIDDEKALGIIQLKIQPSMLHLCTDFSRTTWTAF